MPDFVSLPAVGARVSSDLTVAFGPYRLGAGERLVLFGPNGAGKTTALRLLAGTNGKAKKLPSAAYQPQRPYMFRGSGLDNLALGLGDIERKGALALAERMGLAAKLAEPAATLSGGERQRLALARTLSRSADLVLLDEPLAAIDVAQRDLVTAAIASGLEGKAAVIVTHDREVVATLAHRVAVMIGGRVRQMGTVDDVFTLPADDDVAEAVGLGNVLTGEVVGTEDPMVEVEVDGIRIWCYGSHELGTQVKVLFGAEAVTVHTGEAQVSSARNVWAGSVDAIRPIGRLVELVVDTGARVAAVITPGSFEALGLGVGTRVGLSLKATAARAVAAPGR